MEEATPLIVPRLKSKGIPLHALVLVIGMGGFLFGYDTGVISGALLYLRDDAILKKLSANERDWTEGAIVSATTLGAAFGAGVGSFVSDRFGRRRAILFADVLFVSGSLMLALATSSTQLIAGRFVVGLGVGLASMIVPIFLAEVSQKDDRRAALVSVNVLMITTGQFCSYLVNYLLSFAGKECWRFMLGVAAFPAVFQLLGMVFLPESPRWLAHKGRIEEAREALNVLSASHEDVAVVVRETQADAPVNASGFQPKVFRYQLYVGVTLQVLQQLCGINTIMYYLPVILSLAGFRGRGALLAALLPSGVNSVMTFVGMWAIERVGRRKLLLSSLFCVSIALGLIGTLFSASSRHTPPVYSGASSKAYNTCPASATEHILDCNSCIGHQQCLFCGLESYGGDSLHVVGRCLKTGLESIRNCTSLPDPFGERGPQFTYEFGCPSPYTGWIVGSLVLYLLAFAPGLSPVPWAVNAEIYPIERRGLGSGCSAVANWLSNSLITALFLPLQRVLMAGGVFYLCGAVSLLGMAWTSLVLPETKGLSFEEIQSRFSKKLKLKK